MFLFSPPGIALGILGVVLNERKALSPVGLVGNIAVFLTFGLLTLVGTVSGHVFVDESKER